MSTTVGIRSIPRRRQRIACSGQARHVLDHIDTLHERGSRRQITVTLPLSIDNWAFLQYSHQMTAEEFDQLIHVLGIMRVGLVRDA